MRGLVLSLMLFAMALGFAIAMVDSIIFAPRTARATGCIEGLPPTVDPRLGLQAPQLQACDWGPPLQFTINRIGALACFPGVACGVHLGTDTIGPLPLNQGGLGVDLSSVDKGGLIAGTAPGAVGILPAGSNDHPVVYDSTQPTGLRAGGAVTADPLRVDGGVSNDGGGLKHARLSTGTVPASTTITPTLLWTTPFATAAYTAICSVVESDSLTTAGLRVHHIQQTTVDGLVVVVVNDDGGAGHGGQIDCAAIHD